MWLAGPALAAAEEAEHDEEVPYAVTMMHHIVDGDDWQYPWPNAELGRTVHFSEVFGKWEFTVGEVTIDMTPTRHVIFMWITCAILIFLFVIYAPRRYDKNGVPLGLNNILESLILFVRDDIAVANLGKKDAPKYQKFLMTIFFFILSMNLFGLVPYSATPTSNINVTGALALIAFCSFMFAGMRSQGVVGFWTHLVPSGVPLPLWPMMFPIEFVGLLTKPFALMVRLFANMTAGHIVILSLLGLIFVNHSLVWVPVSVPFALFIYLLELLVSVLQAYIFAMLTALFIGMASHPH